MSRGGAVVRLLLDPAGMSATVQHPQRRRSAGSTIVDAAIALPLLVVLILSVVDVGTLVGMQLALQHGVAQASRYSATGRTESGATREDSIVEVLRKAAPSLTITPADVSFTNLSKVSAIGAGGPTDVVMMSVKHDWKLVSPLLRFFFTNGTATINVSATVANEPFPTATGPS
jgi:Flp pilus assembly protein TadG